MAVARHVRQQRAAKRGNNTSAIMEMLIGTKMQLATLSQSSDFMEHTLDTSIIGIWRVVIFETNHSRFTNWHLGQLNGISNVVLV